MEPTVKRIGDVTIERVITEKKPPPKDEDPSLMNYGTESESDIGLSEEDIAGYDERLDESLDKPTTSSYEPPLLDPGPSPAVFSTSKRKNEFEDIELAQSTSKKCKNDGEGSIEEFEDQNHLQNSELEDDEEDEFMESLVREKGLIGEIDEQLMRDTVGENSGTVSQRARLHSENEDSEYDSEEDSEGEDPIRKLPSSVSVIDTDKTDFIEKLASELGEPSCSKSEEDKISTEDYNYDITEKLKEMGEISVETVKKGDKSRKPDASDIDNEISVTPAKKDDSDSDDKNNSERKIGNMRRNIREVMDETQLDEATLAAQRQEMERLRRVQEQQRIIREVQRQIALNRQNNKTQHRVISLLQGNSSLIKHIPGSSASGSASTSAASGFSGNSSVSIGSGSGTPSRIGGTVLVKLPNGETKPMTRITKGGTPFDVVRIQKGAMQGKMQRNIIPLKKAGAGNLTPSVSIAPVIKKMDIKTEGTDSESDMSDSEKKIRKVAGKPKDVVTISSSSDDDCIVLSEEEPDEPEPEEDPCNSGMHTNDSYNVPDEQGRVLINVGHPENEADVFLAPQIARVIKPHQIGGVRFLFDNVIESVDRFSTSTGFGCILAHSMGLGKTLQIVCFSDIFLRNTEAKTILCIMPINTLQNWMAEYNMWLPKDPTNSPLLSHGEVRPRDFNIYVLNDSHKTLAARAKVIQAWSKEGGVLLIGYELYRLLSLRRNTKAKPKRKKGGAAAAAAAAAAQIDAPDPPEEEEKNKGMFEEIHEALVKPGPDLVICDEGHRIKNSHASISQALKQIRSKRRIVLTGYPLQNNLLEYWCMVDFVRPNYLGTKTEFSNMFERPIQNGQCIDSTPQDIRLMRYRAHVLHSLLEGFVQRRSHAVLQTSLPQKEEYVLLVRMTEFQRKLYDTFMNEVVRTKTVPNPLKAFAVCCKIWNHPDVLYYFLKKHTIGEAVDLDLLEVAGSTTSGSAPSTPATPKKPSRAKAAPKKEKKIQTNEASTPATPKKVSRAKGGVKKERKTAATKKAEKAAKTGKPAASITPHTNTTTTLTQSTTSPSTTTPTPATTPLTPATSSAVIPIPLPTSSGAPPMPPPAQNPPGYTDINPNYPPAPGPYPTPHTPYQNYPQYPQNGDYFNQNQNYPNNYNPGYYPNQEYGGAFYSEGGNGNSMQPYQQENQQQNYWNPSGNNPQQQQPNQQQQQYYNQNGPQGEYYGNMNQQQPGYGNQDYYRYNQNYPPNNMYQPNANQYQQQNAQNWPQQPPNANPQQQDVKPNFNQDFKTDFGSEFKQEYNPAIKQETKDEPLKTGEPILDLDTIKLEEKMKLEGLEDDKKEGGAGISKDDLDEKDFDKNADLAGALSKVNIKEDPGIPYDWAQELMKGYVPGEIENSAKMEIFFCILTESMALGDRILLFSQSLFTLNLIEEFLQKRDLPGTEDNKWAKNKHYYRLDGSTSALEREKLINEYNSNPNIHLFLVSTRAGSLGINLVGANRVIVFDASWNPCHDTQAVCRVYRYGQKKPCFVYRIVMDNCLEKKIYDRQINKQGMADRVVDECNPDAHLSMKDVTNLCWDDEKESEVKDFSTTKDKYIDVVMQKVLDAYSHRLCKEPFQHESLLIDRKEKKLSQAEKRLAKRSYELEKQANINSRPTYSYYNSGSGQGLQIRAIRNQDGILQNKPIASVRPMQSEQMVRDLGRPGGAAGQGGRSRWIPAEVWQRQGMTAQEMTLPLDVVIPTNSPDRGSIVLKAGQKVLVLKSPKGIYMQLECGKIVAIKTAFKVRGGKAPEKGEETANKDGAVPPTTIVKKVPSGANTSKNVSNVPLPLKNNTAITVIPKGQQRLVKPFAQGMTKLNMRSIRQPVPNLIGRQMRMGGPRFTGKIQSIHRKVQLAKAKPYNLEKPGGSPSPLQINPIPIDPTKIKNEPNDREVPELLDRHIVPSSDEEIPVDPPSMISNPDGEKKDEEESVEDPEQFHPHEMYSEGEKSSDIERLSNTDYSESNLDSNRRPSSESCYQSPEKMSSSDSFTNLDQFNNEFAAGGQEGYPVQNDQFIRNNNQDQFGGTQDFQQQPTLPIPNPGKFRNNPDFDSYGIPPTPPQMRIPPNVPLHIGGPNNPNIAPHNVSGAVEMFPILDNRKSIQQESPVIINKFINPTERFHPSMDYPKPGKAEIISVTIPDKPIVIPPPSDKQKSFPTSTITNQPLTIPSPLVSHEQANTKRSLKNYRHNFAGQKAHLNPNQNPNLGPNVTIKPLPGKKTTTSSALHQLEQTTSAIGEVKQAFQETLDSITNSYGSGLADQQKMSEDNNSVIDLDAVEKAEPEKPAKISTSKQPLIHPPIQLDPIKPPPLHRLTPPSNMTIKQPEIHLPVHHPPTSQHLQPNPPVQVHHSPAPGLPTPPQQQPHPAPPQQTQIPMQHPPQHHVPQHQPPHGHQQDYGGPYVGYYGYGAPPVQPYPPPPHQPYYNPPDPAVHYQEIKPKNPTEKPGPNIVSQNSSNIQRSESLQTTPPSAPSSLSSLPTPAPITTPHHTPTPSATPTSYNPISSANAVCTTPTPPNVTTAHSPAIPQNQNPAPISHPPVSGAPPATGVPPGPPTGGFAPYGQPGMPPPPPHGAYDMMGYPQQNQYSSAYPGMPYPNQPNYQPPYQPPAGQYEQPGTGGATYPPGPAPPNMYSAFHRPDVHHPQYGTDPYAQPHYAATVRNAYPPQYGYPPPPAAQAPYGGAPAPGPAPGYDYQYNANGFPPPPPPFVNPYPGLPNNNPVP